MTDSINPVETIVPYSETSTRCCVVKFYVDKLIQIFLRYTYALFSVCFSLNKFLTSGKGVLLSPEYGCAYQYTKNQDSFVHFKTDNL